MLAGSLLEAGRLSAWKPPLAHPRGADIPPHSPQEPTLQTLARLVLHNGGGTTARLTLAKILQRMALGEDSQTDHKTAGQLSVQTGAFTNQQTKHSVPVRRLSLAQWPLAHLPPSPFSLTTNRDGGKGRGAGGAVLQMASCQSTCPPACQPTSPPAHSPPARPQLTCLPVHLPTCLPTHLPAVHLPVCLPTYQPTCLSACSPPGSAQPLRKKCHVCLCVYTT